MATVALPNVKLLYGPMLMGVFFNMILYGVLVAQVLTYHQSYRKDALWMRIFVLFLFVVETANTGFDMFMMYQPLILDYGQKPTFFPTMFVTEPIVIVAVSTPIQLFFAWRIRALTKSWWVPGIIFVFALTALTGGIWTTIKLHIIKVFAKKPLLHIPALIWFLSSCVADVLITISLVLSLSKRKTGFQATDSVIDKIIRMTIQTGMLTALFSILDVVCFMVLPHAAVNFVWDLALSKLYSNCLLSTLNARVGLNNISNSPSQPRNVVFAEGLVSPGGTRRQQESYMDTTHSNQHLGSAVYELDTHKSYSPSESYPPPDDIEYGITVTKVVERVKDPVPGMRETTQ